MIVARDIEARERLKSKLESAAASGKLNAARVRVDRFNFGPPVGFPVQFRVIGPDPNAIQQIAYQVRDIMRGVAIVEATVRRARPAVLTALAAILAMVPLSLLGVRWRR